MFAWLAGRAIPWRLIGIVAVVGLLTWGGVWLSGRVRISYVAEHQRDKAIAEREAEREQNAANIGAIAQDIVESERDSRALIARLDGLDESVSRILSNLPPAGSLVTSREVPGAPCPRPSVSDSFVELFNRPATEAGLTQTETR